MANVQGINGYPCDLRATYVSLNEVSDGLLRAGNDRIDLQWNPPGGSTGDVDRSSRTPLCSVSYAFLSSVLSVLRRSHFATRS